VLEASDAFTELNASSVENFHVSKEAALLAFQSFHVTSVRATKTPDSLHVVSLGMMNTLFVSSSLSRDVVLSSSEGLSGFSVGSAASFQSFRSVSMELFGMVCSLGVETGSNLLVVSEDS